MNRHSFALRRGLVRAVFFRALVDRALLLRALLFRTFLALALGWGALLAPALAAGGGGKGGAAATYASKAYDYYLTGSAADALPPAPATPMVVLTGGGLDVDEAFVAMITKGGGGARVDVVVVRASGADGYNDYLYAMGGVDSVETLVVKTRAGADDENVRRIVVGADVLFIAGGDQWNYIDLWKGTQLEAALRARAGVNVPIGGTSAGLAVLGQFDYSAQNGTITSVDAMGNPYHRRLTLDRSFIDSLPFLAGTIADGHLVTRDRMGRLVTFLARIVEDGWVLQPGDARGIGVDEHAAVVVDDGVGTILGSGAAYFLRPTIAATTLQPKTPLTFRSVGVHRLRTGEGGFDLRSWTRSDGAAPYWLSVENGVLYSGAGGGGVY